MENQTQTNASQAEGSVLTKLETWLNVYLGQKAPQIPAGGREFIVKAAPWIILVILLISLPAILVIFGIGTVLAPVGFVGGFQMGVSHLLFWALSLISFVLEVIALPGLFRRSRRGWQLLYYSSLVGGVGAILSINIFGVITTIIGLYILFQIRSYYK
jgi:hypothetical protein